jgi:hypothetical protein
MVGQGSAQAWHLNYKILEIKKNGSPQARHTVQRQDADGNQAWHMP